ncbi:hypothetical protein BJX65DRAFT_271594 [Aspergillus insuetus]
MRTCRTFSRDWAKKRTISEALAAAFIGRFYCLSAIPLLVSSLDQSSTPGGDGRI